MLAIQGGFRVKSFSFAGLVLLLVMSGALRAQSVSRVRSQTSETQGNGEIRDERIPAQRAVTALKRLRDDVFVYRSLGDFEDNRRLARTPFESFQSNLESVSCEVSLILSSLRNGRLKSEITNSLESFRDGSFWWRKINAPRVVDVSATSFASTRTPSDIAFQTSISYTVAIYWRQAAGHLARAEDILSRIRSTNNTIPGEK